MSNFKVGDRIVLTKDRNSAKVGMKGTIVAYSHPDFGVRFDNRFDGGHDLDGKCESGYGHWVLPSEIKLIQQGFEVGQIYRVGKLSSQHQYENAIVKLVGNRSFWFTVKAIRGEAPNDFGKCSEYARALTLLTGPQIGEAIRKWDAEHGKVREVKRHAKVGEYIKALSVDSCDIGRFKVGDILKVTKEPYEPWAGRGVCFNDTNNVIEDKQYIVLEGYKPEQKGKHSYTAEQIAEAKKLCGEMIVEAFDNTVVGVAASVNPNYSDTTGTLKKRVGEIYQFKTGSPIVPGTAGVFKQISQTQQGGYYFTKFQAVAKGTVGFYVNGKRVCLGNVS